MEKISFDFDGTLGDHFGGGFNSVKEEVQEFFKGLVESGKYDIYIITRRYGPEFSDEGLQNEHEEVFDLLKSLNITLPEENILFTNRKYKFTLINTLGIDIHLDDDSREHELIEKFTNRSSVNIQLPNWKEKFDGLL